MLATPTSSFVRIDTSTYQVVDRRPGALPTIDLKDPATKDKYYKDLKNTMEAFAGVSFLNVDSLKVSGKVSIPGVVLKGQVEILNEADELFDLSAYFAANPGTVGMEGSRHVLENVSITISKTGKVKVKGI